MHGFFLTRMDFPTLIRRTSLFPKGMLDGIFPFFSIFYIMYLTKLYQVQQVAQWATIAHLGASIMFGDNIFNDAQRQVTLN